MIIDKVSEIGKKKNPKVPAETYEDYLKYVFKNRNTQTREGSKSSFIAPETYEEDLYKLCEVADIHRFRLQHGQNADNFLPSKTLWKKLTASPKLNELNKWRLALSDMFYTFQGTNIGRIAGLQLQKLNSPAKNITAQDLPSQEQHLA